MAYDNPGSDSKSKGKYVEFTLPKGAAVPEHEGDEFDQVCRFRDKGDGKVCMTKFGEHEMPEPPHDESKEQEGAEPSYKGMASEIVSATQGPSSSTMDSSY